LNSKILAYVPTSTIKDILTKPDNEGRRGKYIAKIQEYDVEIKPTKLVKGQGIEKNLDEFNCKHLGMNAFSSNIIAVEPEGGETQEPALDVSPKFSQSDWYKDIIFYLQSLRYSPTWDKSKDRSIKLEVVKYFILGENIFWKDLR
jgi:hypothetical protein